MALSTADLRTLAALICANDSPTVGPGHAAKAINDAADEIDRLRSVSTADIDRIPPEWKRQLSLALDMLRTCVGAPFTPGERGQCIGHIREAWRLIEGDLHAVKATERAAELAWQDAEKLQAIVKAWREFGPENGFDELIERAARG